MKYKIIEGMDGWHVCHRQKLTWFHKLWHWTRKKYAWVEIANKSTYERAKKWMKKHKRVNSKKSKYYRFD